MKSAERIEKIVRFLEHILEPGQIVEIRALNAYTPTWRKPRTIAGFYDREHLPELAHAVCREIKAKGIYFTPNPVNPLLWHRCANELQDQEKGQSVSDPDIIARRWLLIDCDPERGDAHISASDDEHQAALDRCQAIAEYLEGRGWPRPVRTDSGNGGHLMYRLDLPNTPEALELVSRCLAALHDRFSDPAVKVDQTPKNASRIWKLPFTWARKGSNTTTATPAGPARPHRVSRVIHFPKNLEVVPQELLEELAAEAPAPALPEPKKTTTATPGTFDLRGFVQRHFPDATESPWKTGGTRWTLEQCPWEPQHTGGKAWIAEQPGGAIAAGCLGDRCRGKTWADLRAMYEPKKTYDPPSSPAAPGAEGTPKPRKPPAPQPPRKPAGEPQEPGDYHRTDLGNAELLWDTYGDTLRYVPQFKAWMVYDEKTGIWREDPSGAFVGDLAIQTGKLRLKHAEAGTPEYAWALQCESADKTGAMLRQLARFPQALMSAGHFDRDPWILNLSNGTLDLRHPHLPARAHDKSDFCTRMAPVSFDTHATCPTWIAFLEKCMAGDREKIDYLQRWAGYNLTGDVSEHKLAIFEGVGRNGKGTFLETLINMLGLTQGLEGIPGYAHKANFETFLDSGKKGNGNEASPDLAALKGARLVVASETQEKRDLNETKVKELTGGDTITARDLYKGLISFSPSHKIMLATNEKPRIKGTDEGIWARLQVIGWNVVIAPQERDPHLMDKLKAELPGILNWCLAGLRTWTRGGLRAPDSVTYANDEYRKIMDPIQGFLEECCCTKNPHASTSAKLLYARFQEWANEVGEHKYESARWLAARLQKKGFYLDRKASNAGFWDGIGLLVKDDDTRQKATHDDDDDEPKPPRTRHVPSQGSLEPNWTPGSPEPITTLQEAQETRRSQAPQPVTAGLPGRLVTHSGLEDIPRDIDFFT